MKLFWVNVAKYSEKCTEKRLIGFVIFVEIRVVLGSTVIQENVGKDRLCERQYRDVLQVIFQLNMRFNKGHLLATLSSGFAKRTPAKLVLVESLKCI